MKYNMGQNLADYAFCYFEKLHGPIFLINKLGKIIKMNEAGRKLMRINQSVKVDLIKTLTENLLNNLEYKPCGRISLKSKNLKLQIIASDLKDSDYFLVEVRR